MAKKRKSETPAVASSARIQCFNAAPRAECGYKMNMKHPITEETHHLFHDADPSTPMFRVVVKANLSMPMADNLIASIAKSFAFLDAHGAGFNSHPHHAHQPHHKAC
jgi:hypothetical protein